ncbi:hypothetical protein D9M71_461700 [compost metagenome]
MHQGIANHEIHQGRRYTQLLGNIFLRHAVQAIHLECVAGSLRQLGQRIGDMLQGREIDVQGFRRSALNHHIQAFLFRPRILQFQRLLAVMVDGQVTHDLKEVAELSLDRGGDLGG